MTLPSLTELKRLQAEATPGPWESKDIGMDEVIVGADGARLHYVASSIMDREYLEWLNDADREVAALAPVLLADNIRMKEELGAYIDELIDEVVELNRHYQQSDAGDALDTVACRLTRILGDTE